MLLCECSITPDVFDTTCYATEDLCAARIETIREAMLNENIVRDLRNGSWSRLITNNHRPWHLRSKELVRKLATQNRLALFAPQLAEEPATDSEWCSEALATHDEEPLSGIIVTENITDNYLENPLVACIDGLTSADWWRRRSPSVRLARTLEGYMDALRLILRHANSIMFVDPHIDLTQSRYHDFIELIQVAGSRDSRPLIEIHRVCYHGSGHQREILDLSKLEAEFRGALDRPLQDAGLNVDVFIWDDFHDRFVLSDLIGINLSNGLDTTSAQNSISTWTRLGRADRDDVQREFDPASHRHDLRGRFSIL